MSDLLRDLPDYPSGDSIRIDQPVVISPELALDISDGDLLSVLNQKITDSTNFFKGTLKLDVRQKKNENYWLGKHFEDIDLYDWQVPYVDNLIHRNTETSIALTSGRMPDIIVVPDDAENKGSVADAKDLQETLDDKIKSEMVKRLIKSVLRDHEINMLGIVKVFWDKNRGPKGDIRFERVRNNRIVIDHSATIPEDGFTADNMEFVGEWIEEPLSVVVAKFPHKRDEILGQFGYKRGTGRQMMTKMRYLETWFTWWDKDGKPLEGLCWRYQNLILDKCKSPYWDWKEKNNLLDMPRKPYMFASVENLGNSPYSDTTKIEQSIPLQNIVNKRGMQITEINDRTVPKLAFAGNAIDKGTASEFTPDPNEHLWIAGVDDVRQAVQTIQADPPSQSLYQDLAGTRSEIDAHFSTHSTTRGESVPNESGISKQITREGDLVAADDVASTTVQRIVEEMANWAAHLMRIMYFSEDGTGWVTQKTDNNGDFSRIEMTRDKIREGISIIVKANAVDKPTRMARAMDLAKIKAIDPYTLFEDLEVPNPKERTKRLIFFLAGGAANGDGWARYLQDLGINLGGSAEGTMGGMDPQTQAEQDIQSLMQGVPPQPPQEIAPEYLSVIHAFMTSPEYQQLDPQVQQVFVAYVDELRQIVSQQEQAGQPPAPAEQPQAPVANGEPAPVQ